MRQLFRYAGLLLFVVCMVACKTTSKLQYYKENGNRFHTLYHITYESDNALTEQIDSTMSAFDGVLNVFSESSVASRFNRNETDTLHPMLLNVIRQAERVSVATNGAYDITAAPLINLWGFGTKGSVTHAPSQTEVDSVRQIVGYQQLIIDEERGRITKSDERVIINPSSLSKGYVVDLVATTLEAYGVQNYLVEIGGEVVAKGHNPKGDCWRVGIDKPQEGNADELIYVLPLCEKRGMASSGNYRNFKLIDGKKVAHTIDLRTGYPSHQDILSATVVAPTCMEADAWATAFMAIGLEEAKRVLATQPQLEVCLIYEDPESGTLSCYQKGLSNLEKAQ